MVKRNYIIILYAISIASISCSSSKDKFNALNSYFEAEVKDTAKEVIVIQQKISPSLTLKLLKANEIREVTANGLGKSNTSFFNEKDSADFKAKYVKNENEENGWLLKDENWTKDDFRHKKIIFERFTKNNDLLTNYVKLKKNLDYKVFYFSDPVYYQNKNYLIFSSGYGDLMSVNYCLVIMEKKENKWVQTFAGYPDWYN